MTAAEWQASADPPAMIRWLGEQGYAERLWQFTIACCRRVWDELPAVAFRRIVQHADQIGVSGIDDVLGEAYPALGKLERKLRKATSAAERARLNRRLGFGRMVFAFEHQVASEAAESISRDLLDWADDPDAERRAQADLLRELAPDPSQRAAEVQGE